MLYKFKSRATPDLIMLEPDGRRLLQIITGSAQKKGILMWPQMDLALQRLEAAIEADELARRAALDARGNREAAHDGGAPSDKDDQPIRLAQRAQPMMQVLRRCLQEEADLVWGV
ncbi:DUF1840 domain-containing protein [Limnohabitans sp.]|uniref:DUF1840 domain-containing protein n=1 Tax=Limnohabitans sp. TaxID=1907725 RepID=UPI00391D0EE4